MRVPPAYTRSIRDVTADFVAASQQLPPGELVKDEFFTLFEAVGALEVHSRFHNSHSPAQSHG